MCPVLLLKWQSRRRYLIKKVICFCQLSFPQFLKKVQRQERIVEEVKLVLKPAYNARKINKEAYKEILRKTVPKVCAIVVGLS